MSGWVGIFGLLLVPWIGIALLWCLRVFSLRYGAIHRTRLYVVRLIAWIMIVLPLTMLVTGAAVMAVTGSAGMMANSNQGGLGLAGGGNTAGSGAPMALITLPMFVLAGLIVLVWMVRSHREAEYATMFDLLAQSVHAGLPLASVLRDFAAETVGEAGARAEQVARRLEAGENLASAIRQSRVRLPAELELAAEFGDDGEFLAAMVQREPFRPEAVRVAWRRAALAAASLGLIVVVLQAVYLQASRTWLSISEDILEASALTVTQRMAPWIRKLQLVQAPVSLLIWFAAVGIVIAFASRWGRDWPVIRRLTRPLHRSRILSCLATGFQQQRPLPEILDRLATCYPARYLRRSLTKVRDDVRAGRSWLESLRRNGLVSRTELTVLQAADRVGNVGWALQEMAERNDRRTADWWTAFSRFAYPVGILICAVPVLIISAYGYRILVEFIYATL
ncbi:MAG: type II secretion system F family protein [Pirellulales bacterium]